MPSLQYPLELRFKLLAFAPRIHVTDSAGVERMFINQKIWNLKEDVLVYNNSNKENVIFRIRADRIIDFSATYRFYQGDGQGEPFGSVKRKGMRSLWRATYYVDVASGQTSHHIKEDNPWTKVLDGLFSEIPIVGMFTGYVFNPSYTIYRSADRNDESHPIMHLKKNSAFFESSYALELADPSITQEEEILCLMSFMMFIQLERRRG